MKTKSTFRSEGKTSVMKKINIALIMSLQAFLFYSCGMGRSGPMTQAQRQKLETAYDSLQSTYGRLVSQYNASEDSLNPTLRTMYAQMRQMHQQMEVNHQEMMTMGNMMGRNMQSDSTMTGSMRMQMQNRMTGEWYQQMMSLHQKMAELHSANGQQQMAQMNRRLSSDYENMMNMTPGQNEEEEVPFNETGNPSLLNGAALYSQNCASCHGSNASGLASVFPPLVNSEWITGGKSIPIRILLNGLSGDIEVNGKTYNGTMPAFKARLSTAGMVAILNYLRSQSDQSGPEITQSDVIHVYGLYRDRIKPWSAAELKN